MKQQTLTYEDCLAYLHTSTFKLQSPHYNEAFPNWPGAVGIEVEMLPVMIDHPDETPVTPDKINPVPLQGEGSLAATLERLSTSQGWNVETTIGLQDRRLLAKFAFESGALTFEPGGQLEFSTKPLPCLSDATRHVRHVQETLDHWLARENIYLAQVGINPWHSLDQLGLQMPKHRYIAMDQYYQQISPYGRRMMRQTCTIQVNLDFGPSADVMVRRYLVGLLASPFATAMFANSPVVDRADTGLRTFRSRIWRHTDPTHTGMPGLAAIAKGVTRDDCIQSYLDYALDANVVFVEHAGFKVSEQPVSFRSWLENPMYGRSPTLSDFETHLSLMFTEIRPRGFLEIRSVDCQSRAWQDVPAIFYCGLLYHDETLQKAMELLLPVLPQAEELLVESENGLNNQLVRGLAQKLFELAKSGFSKLPVCFKEDGAEERLNSFGERFTAAGRTPADDILSEMKAQESPVLTWDMYQRVEDAWQRAARN